VKFWTKKEIKDEEVAAASLGIARASLDGASQLQIVGEALRELRAEGSADRIGIWLDGGSASFEESPRTSSTSARANVTSRAREAEPPIEAAWRGVVWDRENECTPAEWQHLSSAAPWSQSWPQDVVLGRRAVEQELGHNSGQVLIGVLIELHKVLWVPIESRGGFRGMIFCGTRDGHRALPRALSVRLAADLALHLAWQDERTVARERHADIALTRGVRSDLDAGRSTNARSPAPTEIPGPARPELAPKSRAEKYAQVHAENALTRIAESIVDNRAGGLGIGAAFATIAALPDGWSSASSATPVPADVAATLNANLTEKLQFRWKSGDPDWLRTAEGEALSEIWREALRSRHTSGGMPPVSWIGPPISRIVALPIEAQGELCGVMLVGLFRHGTSLAALERLEYRASLAAQAIAQWNRERAQWHAAQWQSAQLAASREVLFILDAHGRVKDLTGAAEELIRSSPDEPSDSVEQKRGYPGFAVLNSSAKGELFKEMFAASHCAPVAAWLQHGSEIHSGKWDDARDVLIAELLSGIAVRLRRKFSGLLGQQTVVLEKVALEKGPYTATSPEDAHSELVLEGVIEWLEEGVVLFDAQNRVRARNTRFEQLAGFAAAESAKGVTLEQLIARMAGQTAEPAKFAERWRTLARDLEGGARDELRLTQPTARILERAARPILDSVGRMLGRVEVYRDLTAQRLFQAQLLQTEKLAALGQMVSGVAHELSNPLTSILGYAQRLLLREDGGGRLPEVRQIFQEAERAGGILRQLLFSARETPPERRRVALNQVILRSMELQRFSMAAEKIRMELDLDPSLPAVFGDAAQLQQVLMNLVGNARQAIEQKGQGGRIRVRTRQVAARRVQLEIEDDGPGVPQSILARIFDPFFTTKAEGVGTGLGLSIVLSIVREHGGRVNVLDAAEGGAIFSIELPMAEGLATTPAWPVGSFAFSHDAAANSLAANPHGGALLGSPDSHILVKRRAAVSGRVLIVEDEPTVARLIADVLQDEGLTVEVFLDGRDGLRRAAEHRFDLVVCDMRMPGLDGQQFYQSLVRAGNELQHSFLFVTGDVIAPATQAFLERNRLPHLAKPFRVEELTERVRDVLERRQDALATLKSSAARTLQRRRAATRT
jgi:signal transduction histidine kinase/CheY-like chemotaxis protein